MRSRSGTVASTYRNRWVQDRSSGSSSAPPAESLFGTLPGGRAAAPEVAGRKTDGVANTNLVWHAGKLLALEEGHAPIAIDPGRRSRRIGVVVVRRPVCRRT